MRISPRITALIKEAFAFCGGKVGVFPVAENIANEVMSIPMSAHLTEVEQDYICEALKK